MRSLLLFTLWILCITLCGAAPAQTKQEGANPPSPAIAVSFARQTIREDDSVQMQIWLANEWEQNLTQVKLHAAIPPFLRGYADTCKEWQEKNLRIGSPNAIFALPLRPHAAARPEQASQERVG